MTEQSNESAGITDPRREGNPALTEPPRVPQGRPGGEGSGGLSRRAIRRQRGREKAKRDQAWNEHGGRPPDA